MLWRCCNQYASKFGKPSSGHRTRKSVSIPIPKKDNAKEYSNYCTIALISHASKVMLKILQTRLQQYTNYDFPDVQAGFRKDRGTRDQMPTSVGFLKKHDSSRKTSSALQQSLWLCGSQQTVENSSRWEYQTTWPFSWEICMQVKKQHDMEQQTGSK